MAEQLDNPLDGRGEAQEAQHTPGPWSQYRDHPLVIVDDKGASLGEMLPGDPYISYEAALANARLVAAAPEMWETLCFYAARDTYNATGGYARPIDRDLGRRAQQALGIYVNPFQAKAADPPALISQEAAREMLAALRAWQAFAKARPTDDDISLGATIPIREFREAQELTRAAIARAEGR